MSVTLNGNVQGASYVYAWFYGDDFLRNVGWTSGTSSMTAEGIRYVYYYANGGENNKSGQTVNATTGKSSLKRNIDTYWDNPSSADLDNVTNVFKRTGYWVKSAS